MDKLRAMAIFVQIVEAGSLTGAAERLQTSLTSVVRTLAALEQVLSVRLLNRTTRRITLTDEGREYFERCRRLLADVEDAEQALSARQQRPTGRLAITAPVMFGRLHVAPLVTDFLTAYPQVRVELLLLDRAVDMLEEGIDVAIRIGSLPESSLVAIPLGTTRYVVCASPDYLGRHGSPLHPGDLKDHRCVRFTGVTPGTEWEFSCAGRPERFGISDILATNQVDAALDACTKGLGCGRFLAYQVHDLMAEGRLVRVLQDYEPDARPVNLIYLHSRLLSPRIRAFVDWAVARLRQRLLAVSV
ncbi:MAG TPA: LysR family transcriptional regulator [Aromatoleum sp.]|uniref:LysR family transcriptional regulator n=1 Tax=Aromatoleum sp. TaxID=2307007 RepID=UPI002B481819|nr:LysR family transcriptional regulator [Aromatoleum sp.]HJV26931.1 LysR family transcriptional regulator [Aromatoleum sp.]